MNKNNNIWIVYGLVKTLKVFKDNNTETTIVEYNENKIYNITEKIPRIKGSNIKIGFKTQEQKNI